MQKGIPLMGTVLQFALILLQNAPAIINAIQGGTALWNAQVAAVQAMQAENRDPTDAEWAALNALLDQLGSAADKAEATGG
jgi:predicted RNA polymerase sigma factor